MHDGATPVVPVIVRFPLENVPMKSKSKLTLPEVDRRREYVMVPVNAVPV